MNLEPQTVLSLSEKAIYVSKSCQIKEQDQTIEILNRVLGCFRLKARGLDNELKTSA